MSSELVRISLVGQQTLQLQQKLMLLQVLLALHPARRGQVLPPQGRVHRPRLVHLVGRPRLVRVQGRRVRRVPHGHQVLLARLVPPHLQVQVQVQAVQEVRPVHLQVLGVAHPVAHRRVQEAVHLPVAHQVVAQVLLVHRRQVHVVVLRVVQEAVAAQVHLLQVAHQVQAVVHHLLVQEVAVQVLLVRRQGVQAHHLAHFLTQSIFPKELRRFHQQSLLRRKNLIDTLKMSTQT